MFKVKTFYTQKKRRKTCVPSTKVSVEQTNALQNYSRIVQWQALESIALYTLYDNLVLYLLNSEINSTFDLTH